MQRKNIPRNGRDKGRIRCVEISLSDDEIREAATAEPDSALPWREIMHHLRSFSRSHPDFTLCEIRTGDMYVKITL